MMERKNKMFYVIAFNRVLWHRGYHSGRQTDEHNYWWFPQLGYSTNKVYEKEEEAVKVLKEKLKVTIPELQKILDELEGDKKTEIP